MSAFVLLRLMRMKMNHNKFKYSLTWVDSRNQLLDFKDGPNLKAYMEKRGFMIGHIDAWDGIFEQTKNKENINQGLKTNKEESK